MADSGLYPMGAAQDDRAPWRTKDNNEKGFPIDVDYHMLKKNVMVTTTDYKVQCDERNDDVSYDTQYTDWQKEYTSEHFTFFEMLATLKELLEEKLKQPQPCRKRLIYEQMLKDCQGWEVFDSDFYLSE